MSRYINMFTACCILSLVSLIVYNKEITRSPRATFMSPEKIEIPRPLRKFVPTPIEVNVTKMCGKICDREMTTCFDPTLSILIYNGTSPEKMSFKQTFTKFMPKIDTEEAENKWKHNRSLCSVNELDESLHTMTKQESCAIVGNSGILLGSECGEEIDSYDFVLRANLALLEGYKKDVGNKTNMMMINLETLNRINGTLSEDPEDKDDMLRYFKLLNGTILWYPKETSGNQPSILRQIATVFLEEDIHATFAFNLMPATVVTKRKWNTQKVATAGLITFTMAQTFCKNVTLYGFYPYQRDEFGTKVLYHYYDPKLTNFHTKTHDFDTEHRLLRRLHDQHMLQLVIGSCKNRNESAGLRPIPKQIKVQRKPVARNLCYGTCYRRKQTCIDPSVAIKVYERSSLPRIMSFQPAFPNLKDTKPSNIKPDSNVAKFCQITGSYSPFRTMSIQQSCAIVGDNGILLNSKCGKEIDSHSFIFRTDMTEAEGSIADVGKRTDIMMLNLKTVDFVYDTLFARRRTSQGKQNYAKIVQTMRYLKDSILWYPKRTEDLRAKKLLKVAAFFRSQKMSIRFGFSLTDVEAQTKRRWKTNEDPSSRLILLTFAETFCKEITLYGFQTIYSNATKPKDNVDKFKNEVKIVESLQKKGVLSQALNPC